jgi:hypothetical protein
MTLALFLARNLKERSETMSDKPEEKKPLGNIDLAIFEKVLKEKLAERMSDVSFRGCTKCPGSCKCSGQGEIIGAGEYGGSWAGSVYVD